MRITTVLNLLILNEVKDLYCGRLRGSRWGGLAAPPLPARPKAVAARGERVVPPPAQGLLHRLPDETDLNRPDLLPRVLSPFVHLPPRATRRSGRSGLGPRGRPSSLGTGSRRLVSGRVPGWAGTLTRKLSNMLRTPGQILHFVQDDRRHTGRHTERRSRIPLHLSMECLRWSAERPGTP
jgi:hypothetical protein